MALETGTYISDLNSANPASSDGIVDADNHIRLIKSTIKATFPNVTGAVNPTQTELNYVVGVTSGLQAQFTAKADLAGPTFTGVPRAPTAAGSNNTTQLATTAYTDAQATAAAAAVTKTASQISDAGAVGRTILQAATAPAATALLSTMVASGASHARGLVPDPGVTAGTTKFLREDATWNTVGPVAQSTASTSGTFVDFTVPSTTQRIDIVFAGVSLSATSNFLIQLSSGGSIVSSGYTSYAWRSGGANPSSTAGFVVINESAASTHSGVVSLRKITSAIWALSGIMSVEAVQAAGTSWGNITSAGTIDRIRITTVNGTDTFDAGTVGIVAD